MKTIKLYFTIWMLVTVSGLAKAQKGSNEFENKRINGDLDTTNSLALVTNMNSSDKNFYEGLRAVFVHKQLGLTENEKTVLTGGAKLLNAQTDLNDFQEELNSAFTAVDKGENVAIIVVYRTFVNRKSAGPMQFQPDFSSLNTKIFHNRTTDYDFSNYLLATKKVYFVFIDISNAYYQTNADEAAQQLAGTTLKINYNTSFLKQSFKDLAGVWKTMGGGNAPQITLTLIKVEPSRIKDPCDLILSNKSFKSDIKFTVHEKNVASFQIGVTDSKLAVKNISISDGNLVVKPSDDQATSWKSNAYALFEMHLPRDIDNFRPLWTSVFNKAAGQKKRTAGKWVYDNLISRVGVYGGLKMAKDPLSNLYAGFNYAITKELGFNFGWMWVNDYATQVTDIGEITSVNDALNYAKRTYSKGKFSIGISFAPSAFSTILGLKSTSADSAGD